MSDTLITVIIPVYNAEKYLGRGIDSVLKQTYENFELILVNDGSKDSSLEVCNKYVEKDSRVRVISQKNSGVSVARNTGIKAASGKYLTFIDSDDYIELDFLEKSMKYVEEVGAEFYIGGYFEDIYTDDKLISTSKSMGPGDVETVDTLIHNVFNGYPVECIQTCWGKLYLKDIIDKNNIKFAHDINMGEDQIFNYQYLLQCNSVIFDDKCYYHYLRINEGSLTCRYYNNIYEMSREIARALYNLKPVLSDENKVYMDLYAGRKVFTCIQYMFSYAKDLDYNTIIEKIKEVREDFFVKNLMQYIDSFKKREKLTLILLKYNMIHVIYGMYSLSTSLHNMKNKK
ncbi:Glycosyl transferase family 2 [Clostridium collagenovorans DSM 3089]|uniref:Glycosyl transferase family 2 n=1 Tax=Clostridium collagenovorans DSM 3089 TaxID=1121306 RepID=A0A1M5YAI1_9CLOT|nr:glycosyltransferase [Clostridium collagenovorans]SHI09057.1 Glycosyl transferase family 2 [Clostridium collagenovorans DSM 3089]